MDAAVKSVRLLSVPNRCDPRADCRHAPGRLPERLCALLPPRPQSASAQAMSAIDPVAMRSNLIQPELRRRLSPTLPAVPCAVLNHFAPRLYETNLLRSASPATN